MPGMLTSIFDGDAHPPQPADGSPIDDTGTGDTGSIGDDGNEMIDTGLSLDQGIALDIGLSNEMGGTYQDLDGSETTWAREDSLNLNVDTSVLLSGDGSAEG